MTFYDEDFLSEINDNVDLVEYVTDIAPEPLELTKKGNEYWTHCPRHIDKTPSLSFSPDLNSYYCFSCNRGGKILNYLMDYENMNFPQAVEKGMQLAHIDSESVCKSQTYAYLKYLKSLEQSKEEFEHPVLEESELDKYKQDAVQEWVDEGIDQNVMELFGIRLDTIMNRIIYPVRDISGTLINIKGRTRYSNYKELHIMKYINYYKVGVLDYFQSLDLTLPYVRESGEIIIFEGIKSVMKAYGWGYKNCASAEKHVLTEEQLILLVKLRVNVVFAYDSDVDYRDQRIMEDLKRLKNMTNVYIIRDRNGLLGGAAAKNSPVDCGRDVWEELYEGKQKIT